MTLLRLACLGLVTAASVSQAKLAGNENYARAGKVRSLRKIDARDSGILELESDSMTFSLGSTDEKKIYLSPTGPRHKSYTLTGASGLASAVVPVTVFNVADTVTCDTLGDLVLGYEQTDDVFDQAFMKGVIFQTNSSSTLDPIVSACLTDHWNATMIMATGSVDSASVSDISVASVSGSTVPQGPYIASIDSAGGVTLTEVYRVYKDEQQAFTSPAIATVDGSFTSLSAVYPGMNTLSIPVPSRLYYTGLANPRPLEGKRVALKDIFDLEGLRTGCGNRAYWLTYEERNGTAPAIQKVIDQGAIIVGKAKTSQFANGETPTPDWQDQLSPFNMKGDGYQDPSTSSAGPGAAMGAYDWLDYAIGSDSGGSVRDPAANNGVFGFRPSHGAVDLDRVMPLASVLDTAGFFARDAASFKTFGQAWYGDAFQNYSSLPQTLYVPSDAFPVSNVTYPGAQAIYDSFIDATKTFLNATIDTRAYADIWNSSGTIDSEANGETIPDFFNLTYAVLIGYDQWLNFGVPWFADYASINDDRLPFIDTTPKTRWAFGEAQGADAYTEAVRRKNIFKTFLNESVLLSDEASCTDSLYLYPINPGSTSYRNIYKDAPTAPTGVFWEAYSPFAETPELVIPLGQTPYTSTITNHTEYLPVSIAIQARSGCDYVLMDLAAQLEDAGIISPVITGSLTFAL